MKNLFYLIFLFLLSNSVIGQALKTYSGPFEIENILDQNAVANYTYKDDPTNYQRVKNGLFSLVFKGTGNYAFLGNVTVSGNYKDNLKTGKWSVKLDYNNIDFGDIYGTGTLNLVCNYKNGELDGAFLFTSNITVRTKSYNYKLHKYVYSKPSLPETKKITATFDRGAVVGNYNYILNDPIHRSVFTVVATLDSDSILKDKYVESGDGKEFITEYKNGFRIRNIDKNLQTGEVKIDVNESFASEDSIYSEYLKAKATNPDVEESTFKMGCYNGGCAGYDRLKDVIGSSSDMFIYLNVGGDLTMERIKNRGLWAFLTRGLTSN